MYSVAVLLLGLEGKSRSLVIALLYFLIASEARAAGLSVERARQLVEKGREPVTFAFKGPPFSPAKARGATVYYFNARADLPASRTWSSTLVRLLERYGVRLKVIDGKGGMPGGLEDAMSERPDGIVTVGIEPRNIVSFESRARRLQIPFLAFHASRSRGPSPVAYPIDKLGSLAAAWVIAQGTEHRDCCLGINASALDPELTDLTVAFAEGWKDVSGHSDYEAAGDWSTNLSKLYREFVPGYVPGGHKYLICVDDRTALPMVEEAARLNDTKGRIVVFNPSARSLELIQRGTALKVAVGSPNRWMAYAMGDQILRALTGNPVVGDEEIPVRLFDAENISSVDLDQPEERWYGPVDLEDRYGAIWSGPDTGTKLPVIRRAKPPEGPCAKLLEAGFEVATDRVRRRYRALPDLMVNDPDPIGPRPHCESLGPNWHFIASDVVKLIESFRHSSRELSEALDACGVNAWYGPEVCAPCAYRGPQTPPCPCSKPALSNWVFCSDEAAQRDASSLIPW